MKIGVWVNKRTIPVLILLGILIGTAYANISVKYLNMRPEAFSNTFLAAYEEVEVNVMYLWRYIFKTRFRDYIVLAVLSFTNLSRVAVCVYAAYFGMALGSMISFAVMYYGLAGILVYIASIVPQYMLYIYAYVLLYKMVHNNTNCGCINTKKSILTVIVAGTTVFMGTYLEARVNPMLMRWVYSVLWF